MVTSSIMRRRHGLVGHGGAPVLSEVVETPRFSRQDAPLRLGRAGRRSALPLERFSPLAQTGPPVMSALRSQGLATSYNYSPPPICVLFETAARHLCVFSIGDFNEVHLALEVTAKHDQCCNQKIS